MPDKKAEKEKILLPEGRIINQSLFVMDQFNEQAAPSYKIELAFGMDDLDEIQDKLAAAAVAEWGPDAAQQYIDNQIIDPILSGNIFAARREAKGKQGDAYKDKLIIRAKTIFNRYGLKNGSGGIQVYDENVEEVIAANQEAIYEGCYGRAVVVIDTYVDQKTSQNALMFYLAAFQKTRDGERLFTAADHSAMFKPVGRDTAEGQAATGGRKKRAG